MKRNFKFLFTLAIIVFSMIFSSGSVFANTEKTIQFEEVSTSDVEDEGIHKKTIEYNNELYIILSDQNRQIRVKKYNGTNWIEVDNGTLNYDTLAQGYEPDAIVYDNELYVSWYESDKTKKKIVVKKYDGTKWISVGENPLNYDISSRTAEFSQLIIYKNEVYIVWKEKEQIRLKKYDGTNWISVDDGGLEDVPSYYIHRPNAAVYNNELYIAWVGANSEIKVKKYDGSKWTSIDNSTLNEGGIRSYGYKPSILVYNDEIYISWSAASGVEKYQVRVKKYDGTKWISVDNKSLNYDVTTGALEVHSIVHKNELYVTWYEKRKVRMKKYNGTKWVSIDNGSLNYNSSSKYVAVPEEQIFNDELYVSWFEEGKFKCKKLVSSNTSPEEKPPVEKPSEKNGDKALIVITMVEGTEKEYDMTMKEVNDFIDWYNDESNPCYIIEKNYNIGPFESRKDYIVREKIVSFEVMEYNK